MKTALLTVATGTDYHVYAKNLLSSARRFFVPHHSFVWTDTQEDLGAYKQFQISRRGFPYDSLLRYHMILEQESELQNYDYLFLCDADMLFVSQVSEQDIFANGITATLHPGFYNRDRKGTPELRPESMAYCPDAHQYFCGGFIGGTTSAFLWLAKNMCQMIDADGVKNLIAVWHDESYLQRILFDFPPAKILSPAYCYPDGYDGHYNWEAKALNPVLVALSKEPR